MNCPYCNAPLMGGMTSCPKCKYDTRTTDGGAKHREWLVANGFLKSQEVIKEEKEAKKREEELSKILVTSGFTFVGYQIEEYSDYISCDEVTRFPATDIYNYKDKFAQNLTGPLVEVRKKALLKLKSEAYSLGCNALVGVSYDYYHFENVAQDHGIASQPYHFICVTANGTAIKIKKQ